MALEKTIEVEKGRSVTFRASALSPLSYKLLFKRDFFKDLEGLSELEEISNEAETGEESQSIQVTTENYEMFMRIAFCMAYQGVEKGLNTKKQREFLEQYPDMWTWLDSFETFSMFTVLPEIISLWGLNAETQVNAKNAHHAQLEN
jgi:hypothetical protein